jgi:tetratricopeptide (TPR) repeat protein
LSFGAKGDSSRAVADYNRAIEVDPGYALAFYNRGMTYHAQQKFDQAMADINQAIKLNPNYGKAFYERGMANYDKFAFDRTIVAEQASAKPAYINNFGDRGVSYGNRREGDRIAQDPHQAIKNNHYNAFAYSPSAEEPTAAPANRPQTLVAPDPAAAVERKEQQAKSLDAPPASAEKPRGAKTATASNVPPLRSELKVAIPVDIVPLPQARPLPRHRR